MKIGSTTLPLAGWLADPRQPKASRKQRLAAIRQLVEDYGLSAVELTADLALIFPQVFDAGFYASVADLQQALGFVCTVHLPFLWVDPASPNEPVRQASIDSLRRAVEVIRLVEVSTYVLHLWGLATTQIVSVLDSPVQRQGIFAALMAPVGRSLAQACDLVEPQHLCVENLETPPFDIALPIIEQYDVSICLDVGHLAWEGINPVSFLVRHSHRIREVHLHDAALVSTNPRPIVRDHLPLGQGEIDHLAFVNKLEEIGFGGPVILENNSQTELEESLKQLRPFL